MPENVKLFAKMDPSIPNEEQNFFIKETHHTIVGDRATTPPLRLSHSITSRWAPGG